MAVYIFMVLFLYSCSWLDFKANRKIGYILFTFIFFLFVLHDGLRWETGTDWGNYYRFFLNCLWDEWEQFEPGYVLFNQLIRGLTIDYNVFLLCEAVIVWGLIFPTIRKYSPDPLLTLFCLYCTLLPVLGMNRQLISLAISIYSIRFILNRQWIFFYLSILLACPFHLSILIFAVAYFLNSKLKTKYYVLLLVVCIGLSVFDVIDKYFGEIVPYVSGDDTRLMGYTEIESTGVNASFLGIARKSLWLFLAYPLLKKEREGLLLLSFNLYFLSLLIYTIFNGTDFQIIVSRGTNYFTIYEVFIVSYVVYGYKGKGVKIIMLIMIFVYFIGMLYKGIDYYSVGRYNPFIPYQCCF